MNLLQGLKKLLGRREPQLQEDLDGSLRGQALRRALNREAPRVATPHDWEDYEAYQASMERLEARMRAREHED